MILNRSGPAGLALLLLSTAVASPAEVSAQPVKEQDSTVTGYGGAVASEDPEASRAGMEILDQGGNAVDAAIATAAAQGVTRPFSGGIGGGGMMLIHLEGEDEPIAIDSRSAASGSFNETTYTDPDSGLIYPAAMRISSGSAFAVPGTVKNWETALEDYGTMTMEEVLAPAVAIAENGFTVDDNFVREARQNADRFSLFTSTSEIYLDENGNPPEAGDIIRNSDLAETYRMIGEKGAAAFYEGDIAEAIVDTVNDPPLTADPDYRSVSTLWETDKGMLEGELTMNDLSSYETNTYSATHSTYRDYDVYGAPPSSSGGITVGESLEIMNGFDIGSSKTDGYHHFMEATRLAVADRREYIGDPAFTDIPMTGMLSKGFAEERRQLIDSDQAALGQIAFGNPWPYEENPNRSPDSPSSDNSFSYDFSGENGSNWDQFKFHRLDTGPSSSPDDASFTINNNTGVFSVHERKDGRGSAYGRATANMQTFANPELNTSFQLSETGSDQRLRLWLQGDVWRSGSSIPENGYGLEINAQTEEASLLRAKDSSFRTIARFDYPLDTHKHNVRFVVDGNDLKFNLWSDADSEPDEWTGYHSLAGSDRLSYGEGKFLLSAINFDGSSSQDITFDEILIDEWEAGSDEPAVPASIQSFTAPEEPENTTSIEEEEQMIDEEQLREQEAEQETLEADESTIHLSVTDKDGNVAGYTTTIVSIGGNGMVVPNHGFLLNNALYGRTPGGDPSHPNYPRPGMRSLSSMSPTLLMKDGNPELTVGAPGSDTILTTVLQLIISSVDFDMPLPEAFREPRVSQRNNFDSRANYEARYWNTEFESMKEEWEAMGHRFTPSNAVQGIGAATGIEFLGDGIVRPVTEETRRGGGSAVVQSEEPMGPPAAFPDIQGHWAQEEIEAMVESGIIEGRSPSEFAPNADVTRAEFATLVTRAFNLEHHAAGEQEFDDVAEGAWYAPFIDAAASSGIINGYETAEGLFFGPGEEITREEMAAMIVRAVEMEMELEAASVSFTDEENIAPWAKEEVAKAAGAGLIQGNPDGSFEPKAPASRAQAAIVFFRALELTNVPAAFPDIEGHWAEREIGLMVETGVIEGRSAEEFAPNDDVTRAEFATLITRAFNLEVHAAGSTQFEDVADGSWYAAYVDAASTAGIINGYETADGLFFRPAEVITREEMAAMLVRAVEISTGEALERSELSFTDSSEIAPWAEKEVGKAAAAGLIQGNPQGAFQPKASASRAESAVVFHRSLGRNN
ncbi:gamma-glutamyltransferase [Alkalicoccus halolimnae]|uniref:Gamma-glutamyltransferase n=1 Tax=Alkalicoccus halolimnae TaxID=1667239 RepID=A0A5C7F2X8_9BACI|nr:gamma-glutamyltransferase [Alkalicoccus halolimnae]TXF84673.1 hypothetical protein FTX54_10765 [Alkalicoccus halolimnae]